MGKIGIIIGREFNTRVRKKSFIITTLLTPLLMVGLVVVPAQLATMKSDKDKVVLVVDRSGVIADSLENRDHFIFRPQTASYEELRGQKDREAFGILVIGADIMDNPKNAQLYTYASSTIDTERDIARQIANVVEKRKLLAYDIENLPQIMEQVKTTVTLTTTRISEDGTERESSSVVAMISAYLFGFLIYMFVFMYGAMVMQGVIEEKSSKVMEIMVSSVRPYELMMGKIVGIAAVAITQFFIWMVLIFALGTFAMQFFADDIAANAQAMQEMAGGMAGGMGGMDPEMMSMLRNITDLSFLGKIFGGFVIYFIGGYLLYAAMFAAIGSAVDNAEDTQQLQLPISIPLVLAIVVLVAVLKDPDGSLAFWFSMIPFTSPVIMMARIPYGVPFWELALSVAILYASFIGMVWLAGKVYRVGVFMYGKKPTWGELYKWMRYKS
ncbi:MAG: ABC transporter permease [Rikenellaceae bacterium]|jgi:ABC-2 type transport system permease protein|nr:ABC transporter permease [Rikenellaceae bacterium]